MEYIMHLFVYLYDIVFAYLNIVYVFVHNL